MPSIKPPKKINTMDLWDIMSTKFWHQLADTTLLKMPGEMVWKFMWLLTRQKTNIFTCIILIILLA